MTENRSSGEREDPPGPRHDRGTRTRIRALRAFQHFGILVVLCAGVYAILVTVDRHHPVHQWLFFRHLAYVLVTAVWTVSCLCLGGRVLRLLGTHDADSPPGDVLLFSLALGVLAFHTALFVLGILGLLGPATAVLLPAAFLAAGAPHLRELCQGASAGLRRPLATESRLHLLGRAIVLGFGLLGVGMVYFMILPPENAAYDARWYHLGLAEHYAAEGGIRRFPEGWFYAAFPHLASVLYTWCFTLPLTDVFDRVLLSAHLEFSLFLWTLAGIPALVRRLVPGVASSLSWPVLFLFPGILVYDSALGITADHVLAFWAVPIALALLDLTRTPTVSRYVLLALCIAGAALTKYTALLIIAAPILAALARGVISLVRGKESHPAALPARGATLRGLLLFAAVGLAATSPHWLKNWIWYGDPIYPVLHQHLDLRPWTADAATRYDEVFLMESLKPQGTAREIALETLKVLFTFSFEPHDFYAFHRNVPVFGFLFTVFTLALPFLRGTRCIWALAALTWAGIAVWFLTYHVDRYLQPLLPWMAAVTAASIVLVARTGRLPALVCAALVLLQVVWGGDLYFYPSHAMTKRSPPRTTVDYLSMGYLGRHAERVRPFGEMGEIGRALPPGARVLLHDIRLRLGLGRAAVQDAPGNQGGISYARLGSEAEIHQLYRRLGVTHLAWMKGQSRGTDNLAGELLFFAYAFRAAHEQRTFGRVIVARVPETATLPAPADSDLVTYLGCEGHRYRRGLYALADLDVTVSADASAYPPPREAVADPRGPDDAGAAAPSARAGASRAEAIARSGYVVLNRKCVDPAPPLELMGFVFAVTRGDDELWIRP